MSKKVFLILSGNRWYTENIQILLVWRDPQNLGHLLWVSESRRMNILSLPSCSFTPHRIISRAHHSLQNIPLQNARRVELILIPDGAWSAITGLGEAFLCVVQLRVVPSLQGSLYSKDTWKSRLPFLRMETVPIVTDSCEVILTGEAWGGGCVCTVGRGQVKET